MSLSEYHRALVTGASSGIGAAVASALAARGMEVHVAARRRPRLEELAAATGCVIHALDLRDTRRIREEFGSIEFDILVNNAGTGRGFEELYRVSPDDIDTTLDTNVRAVFHLLRVILPGMVERKRGHVINVGSMAGLYALKSTIYGASKGAVHMLSRNLRIELQGSGVRVTEICPGRVTTELYDVSVDDPVLRSRLKNTGIRELSPGDVADAILYALEAPWHVNVNLIELQPTEQTYGGYQFVPVE
jgi:3-hydroxy acid dehydrogenase/malonic semialdehyde reductase